MTAAICSVLLAACVPAKGTPGFGARPPEGAAGAVQGRRLPVTSQPGLSEASAQVRVAWLAAEEAFNSAALTSDSSEPALGATTVPPQLTWSESVLDQMRSEGKIATGSVQYGTPRVFDVRANLAEVESCIHDREIVIWSSSGRRVAGELGQVEFELIQSSMTFTGGGWKLLTQEVGVGSCA
jgi:hypothetical protein